MKRQDSFVPFYTGYIWFYNSVTETHSRCLCHFGKRIEKASLTREGLENPNIPCGPLGMTGICQEEGGPLEWLKRGWRRVGSEDKDVVIKGQRKKELAEGIDGEEQTNGPEGKGRGEKGEKRGGRGPKLGAKPVSTEEDVWKWSHQSRIGIGGFNAHAYI